MIKAEGLTKRYRDFAAIEDVSFEVPRGEIVALLGPNGAGKSTTLRVLVGALPPTAGRALIDGADVFDASNASLSKVGYAPEVPPVYDELTVHEYLRFVGKLKRVQDVDQEIDRVSKRLSLADVRSRLLRNLSKGFRQRTGLAQALLGAPPVLILDEPTAGLDPRQIGELRTFIKELAGDHTVLVSTHMLNEVTALCERAVILSRGRVVADARLEDLAGSDNTSLEETFLQLTES